MSTLTARATDAQGFIHNMLLLTMNVPRLGCHMFSGGTVALKGVNTIIAKQSYLNVGQFNNTSSEKTVTAPPSTTSNSSLPQPQNRSSVPDEGHLGALPTDEADFGLPPSQERGHGDGCRSRNFGKAVHRDIYGGVRYPGTTDDSFSCRRATRQWCVRAALAFTATTSIVAPTTTPGLPTATATATPAMSATAMAMAGANIWHQRLGHPNEYTMPATRNIAKTTADFTDSLTASDICEINKGAK